MSNKNIVPEDSLSDDSKLSSTSLLKSLIEKSESEQSFTRLTFEEKFKIVGKRIRTSFLSERSYFSEHDKYIEQDLEKSFHQHHFV